MRVPEKPVSEKSSFYLPAFEISRTSSGVRANLMTLKKHFMEHGHFGQSHD
jgi:hypothetical protein